MSIGGFGAHARRRVGEKPSRGLALSVVSSFLFLESGETSSTLADPSATRAHDREMLALVEQQARARSLNNITTEQGDVEPRTCSGESERTFNGFW
jgi:hypothetical protein